MKTIQISDELYEKLEKISNEMNTQDHRGTRQPYIFRILVPNSRPAAEWCWDFNVWIHDWEEAFRDENNDFLQEAEQYIKNYYSEDEYEDLDFDDQWDVEEFLEDHDFEKWEMTKYDEEKWFFLTHESAKRHWESNKHHYPDEFNDYLDHCWRDPDMEAVQQFLCELTGGKLHT